MQLSSKFIINSILMLAIISVSVAGFVVNDLFTITFNIEYLEPQTNIKVDFRVDFQFRREDFILRVFNEEELLGVPKGIKLAEKILPYDKINDVDFLSNTLLELIDPIINAIIKQGEQRGIIIRPEDREKVINFSRDKIRNFLLDNKKGLDEVAKIANIFKNVITAMMPFFILNSLYMISSYKFFLISLILFILVLAMTIIFTAFVILLPPKISEISEGIITLKSGFTMTSYLANSYVALLMFFVNWFASDAQRVERFRQYTKNITRRFSTKKNDKKK
mgnify:CR=1 FL=1|jgi:hypothetical protein